MNTFFEKLPWSMVLFACLTVGLAPFSPPHILEKISMLMVGNLVRPIDWFDLCFHGLPWALLLMKIIIHFNKSH